MSKTRLHAARVLSISLTKSDSVKQLAKDLDAATEIDDRYYIDFLKAVQRFFDEAILYAQKKAPKSSTELSLSAPYLKSTSAFFALFGQLMQEAFQTMVKFPISETTGAPEEHFNFERPWEGMPDEELYEAGLKALKAFPNLPQFMRLISPNAASSVENLTGMLEQLSQNASDHGDAIIRAIPAMFQHLSYRDRDVTKRVFMHLLKVTASRAGLHDLGLDDESSSPAEKGDVVGGIVPAAPMPGAKPAIGRRDGYPPAHLFRCTGNKVIFLFTDPVSGNEKEATISLDNIEYVLPKAENDFATTKARIHTSLGITLEMDYPIFQSWVRDLFPEGPEREKLESKFLSE